jgi:hemerythrin-like metal-binding protein
MLEKSSATEDVVRWDDTLLLGFHPMDDVHEEFVGLLGRLQRASIAELPDLMNALVTHTQAHFDLENTWMVDTEFPPRDCHIDEHEAVLRSINEVRQRVARGDHAMVPSLVDALADWFPRHAVHLDSALAHWMCKKRLGGKPVVIRRGLTLR